MLDNVLAYLEEHWEFLGVLALGLWGAYSTVRTSARNEDKEDREAKSDREKTILDRTKNYADLVEESNRELRQQVNELQTRNIELALELANVKAATNHISQLDSLKLIIGPDPGIIWAKERISANFYKMVRVSLGYARLYLGGPPEIYDNKMDIEIYPNIDAGKFNLNDELSYSNQHAVPVVEEISGSPTGTTGWFVGRKYYVRLDDKDIIIGAGRHVTSKQYEVLKEHGFDLQECFY